MVATLLAVNRRSRSGSADTNELRARLQTLGPVAVVEIDSGTLESTLDAHRSTLERIVVGGGDGTIHHLLPTLVDAGLPCGIVPLGTANDLARSLKLPLDPLDAVEPILAGQTATVRLATVNDRLFVNAIGIGLGPSLTKKLDHERKRRLGVFAYLSSLFDGLHSIPRRRANLTIDGQCRRVKFMQITVANGVHYGGGMTIAEDARLDDGYLRLLCLEPQSVPALLKKFVLLRWGARGNGGADRQALLLEAYEVVIETDRKADVTADGELIGTTPVVCSASTARLQVYAPQT